jgi:hypothetical protein
MGWMVDWVLNHADRVSALGQWTAVLVAVFGFAFVWRQLAQGNEQQRLATKAATSQLYGLVSSAMDTVNQFFLKHNDYYDYFFDKKPVPEDRAVKAALLRACDVVMNLVDAITEQKRVLPDHIAMDWTTWETYMRDLYKDSPIFKQYLHNQLRNYPDYTFAELGYLIVREIVDGRVLSTWTVAEEHPFGKSGAAGYPWIGTWKFTKLHESTMSVAATVSGATTGEVKVLMQPTRGQASDRELCVLQYWIIGTMEGTTVRKVRFHYPENFKAPEGELYRTGRRKRSGRTFAFVIPEYEAVWPVWALGRRWQARFGVIKAS